MLSSFTMATGGAEGSDWYWEQIAIQYQVKVLPYSFYGHKIKTTQTPKILLPKQLMSANKSLMIVNEWFKQQGGKRTFPSNNPYITKLLQRDYYTVHSVESVLAIGEINFATNIVNGGTGWGVGVGILEKKPVFVYDYMQKKWYIFDYSINRFINYNYIPLLTQTFAGIGTRGIKIQRGKYEYPRHILEAMLLVFKNTDTIIIQN